MTRYKSWKSLSSQLNDRLCDELKSRIQYFLTRYHKVHNSYGRASIRLDKKEIISFTWIEMYHQEWDTQELYKKNPNMNYEKLAAQMKPAWDENCTYSDINFINAALNFLNIPIHEALESDNYIIKILAIMDRRIGKRTLLHITASNEYNQYPRWVRQFYNLRLHGAINPSPSTTRQPPANSHK